MEKTTQDEMDGENVALGKGPPKYKRGRGYSFFRNGPRGNNCCQVPDCGKTLMDMKRYYKRYKICPEHMEMEFLVVDGHKIRFCQQCGRFQPLDDFDGAKKSCRERLAKHNGRRRKTPNTDDESIKTTAFDVATHPLQGIGSYQGISIPWHGLFPAQHQQQMNSYNCTVMPSLQMNQEYHKAKLLAEAVSMIHTALENCSPLQSANADEDRRILQSTMNMLQQCLQTTVGRSSVQLPAPTFQQYHRYQSPPPMPPGHPWQQGSHLWRDSCMGTMMTNPVPGMQAENSQKLMETLTSYLQRMEQR